MHHQTIAPKADTRRDNARAPSTGQYPGSSLSRDELRRIVAELLG